MTDELGPCPKCGKRRGEVVELKAGKFRYYVDCTACEYMTEFVTLRAIAVKLWNEAKKFA